MAKVNKTAFFYYTIFRANKVNNYIPSFNFADLAIKSSQSTNFQTRKPAYLSSIPPPNYPTSQKTHNHFLFKIFAHFNFLQFLAI